MGVELLEPLAKWGVILVGSGALVGVTIWQLKKGARDEARAEASDAKNKALEEQAGHNAKTRETRSARRARLRAERKLRNAND